MAVWNRVRPSKSAPSGLSAPASLRLQESLGVDAGLFEDRTQRSLGHVAWVVGDGGVSAERRIEPDLVRASCLPVEYQSEMLQPLGNFAIAKTAQRALQVATISG